MAPPDGEQPVSVKRDGRRSIARNLYLSSLSTAPSVSIAMSLPATGRLNPATLIAMFAKKKRFLNCFSKTCRYDCLARSVRALGCEDAVEDLVFGYAQVSTLIKQMQEKKGVYVSGAFDEQTLALLR